MARQRLEDKFGDLGLDKPVTIEIEDRELELEMTANDIHPMLSIGDSQGNVNQEDMEQLTETLRTVLRRTYLPYYDKVREQVPEGLSETQAEENEKTEQYIEGLLRNYLFDIFVKITNELGWQDEIESVDDVDEQARQDFQTSPQN